MLCLRKRPPGDNNCPVHKWPPAGSCRPPVTHAGGRTLKNGRRVAQSVPRPAREGIEFGHFSGFGRQESLRIRMAIRIRIRIRIRLRSRSLSLLELASGGN